MNLSFGKVLGDTLSLAFKNIPSVLGAALLWLITIWVPYVNVGTTIALFYGMPLELSRGTVMSPTAIFDAKYRKYMGEFFAIVGLMAISIIPAYLFMVVPGIIISIGWSFAVMLLVDKEMNPTEAMQKSTEYTYGYKWLMFVSSLVLAIILGIIWGVLLAIFGAIGSAFLFFIIVLCLLVFSVGLNLCLTANFYRYLVIERGK